MSPMLSNLSVWWYQNAVRVPWISSIFLGILFGILFTLLSIRAARRFDFLARPNFRSSHTIPTPRIGGVGIGAAFLAVMLCSQLFFPFGRMYPTDWFIALVVGGMWAAVGGFLDDVLEFRPAWKAFFQLIPLAVVFLFGVTLKSLYIPFVGIVVLPYWLQIASTVIVVIGLMNVYNFMDGMDGNAGFFALFVLFGMIISIAAVRVHLYTTEVLAIGALIGAIAGFLQFNRPGTPIERKTFMGDSGSQFVGFALAVLALHGNDACDRTPILGSLILVSPFVYDVTYTLTHRLWRRVNVFKAHREHLYQRMLILCNEDHGTALHFAKGQFILAMSLGLLYNIFNWILVIPSRHPLSEGKVNLFNWCLVILLTIALLCLVSDTIYIRRRERKAREEATAKAIEKE